MNEYDQQANKFLQDFNVTIKLEEGKNKKPCGWKCGKSYRVTVKKGKKRMSFDFHDSIHNLEMGFLPSNYDILACMSSDSYCPDTVEEFVEEYGKEQKHLFRACKNMSDKISNFFTEEEMEELREIQ